MNHISVGVSGLLLQLFFVESFIDHSGWDLFTWKGKSLSPWPVIFPSSTWMRFLLWMLYFAVVLGEKCLLAFFPSGIIFDANIHNLSCIKNETENASHFWRCVSLHLVVHSRCPPVGIDGSLWQCILSPCFEISSSMREYPFMKRTHQILICVLNWRLHSSVLCLCFYYFQFNFCC